MLQQPNRLRAALNAGRVVHGTVACVWSPVVIDVAGLAGLDFVRIDTEHAWRRDEAVEHMIRAAHLAGVTPLVRVDRDDPYLVRKALEIGAGAVLVPDIHGAEEAADVVAAAKFPPRGRRGFSGLCWSGGWGAKAGEAWADWSDSEPMIGVMIETPDAIAQISEIMAVDGLDYVLFGPADYSMHLGLRSAKRDHPEVLDALRRTIAAAKENGKHVVYGVGTDPENIQRCIEMGVTMLEYGNDVGVLRSGWAAAVEAAKSVLGEKSE